MAPEAPPTPNFGIVAIGRNEGERLRRCLESAMAATPCVVYVDSGSTDDSLEIAGKLGVELVKLDLTVPFTAARARNAGFERLSRRWPTLELVQFVDGDCELAPGWISAATEFLADHPDYVAVHGRRRERFPEASIYNHLCDLDWDRPTGDARAFGGDVMIRCRALADADGYREDFIAGEEPELCVRLRARGWKIRSLAAEMTLHDAAMFRFGQWWRRSERCGYAYALGASVHGGAPERHKVRETMRVWAWTLGPPLLAVACGILLWPAGLLVLLVYPLQWARLFRRAAGSPRLRALVALSELVGKFAELQGQLGWLRDRMTQRRRGLIEYK